MKRLAAALALPLLVLAPPPASAEYLVREIGSFHVSGRNVTLSGLPQREITFTPGAPPLRVDPNGEFEAEQMYV